MTTIVYQDGILASDSRATLNDMISPAGMAKIYHPGEGEYWEVHGTKCLALAFAGSSDGIRLVIDLLNAGMTHHSKVPVDAEIAINAILVLETQEAYVFSAVTDRRTGRNQNVLIPMNPPIACGSGEPYAYSVLSIGKSAEYAVKHAMRLDPYTGGDIVVWECPAPPEVPSVRPAKEQPQAAAQPSTLANVTLDQLKDFIHETMDNHRKPSETLENDVRDAGPMKIKPAAA